jgi:hypothetical protein
MTQKTKLAKSIALVIASSALSIGAVSTASAHVMYNTFTTTATSATDGWTRTAGPSSNGNTGAIQPWVGTAGGALPFGYTGSSHLNWAAEVHNAGDSLEVSSADSLADYGFAAEIDTGGGAWRDTSTVPTGWKHQTDIGLIKSDVTQKITINLTALSQLQANTFSKFGVTLFEGMDTKTGNYSHHGSWNNPAAGKPYTANNPFGTTGLTNIGYSDNVDAVHGFTFTAQAGQIYSLYLGGVDFSKWNTGVDNYKLNIASSPVPVPGAVWLFGSALAGVVGLRRRNQAA